MQNDESKWGAKSYKVFKSVFECVFILPKPRITKDEKIIIMCAEKKIQFEKNVPIEDTKSCKKIR